MSKLIFKLKADERKWPAHVSDVLGESLAEKCSYEVDATKDEHWARVILFEFNNDKSLLNKLEKDQNVMSIYLVDNNEITKRIR